MLGEVEHVVQGQQAGGHALQVLCGVAVLGVEDRQLRKGPIPLEQRQPGVEAGELLRVTHGEAQFAELPGTEGTAPVSTQPGTGRLPFQLKGSLAQDLQLLPLLLRVIIWGWSRSQIQGQAPAAPSLCIPKAPTWL